MFFLFCAFQFFFALFFPGVFDAYVFADFVLLFGFLFVMMFFALIIESIRYFFTKSKLSGWLEKAWEWLIDFVNV